MILKPVRGTQLNLSHPDSRAVAADYLINAGGGDKLFDSSLNNNIGTLSGGYSWKPGKDGSVVNLDGISGRATLSKPGLLNFGDGASDLPFSIIALVKMDDTTRFRAMSKGNTGTSTREWALTTTASSLLRFQLTDLPSSNTIFTDTASLAALVDQDVLIAGIYNANGSNTGLEVCVVHPGGMLTTNSRGSLGSYVAMHDTGSGVYIGNLWNGVGANNQADGRFSSVYVVRRALSFSDIARLAANYYARYKRPSPARYFFIPSVAEVAELAAMSKVLGRGQIQQYGIRTN